MDRKKLQRVLLAAMLSGTLASCGFDGLPFKGPVEDRRSHSRRVFVHGDPAILIEGATLNKKSFLTVDSFETFEDFNLASLIRLSRETHRKTEDRPLTQQEIEELNQSSGIRGLLHRFHFVPYPKEFRYRSDHPKVPQLVLVEREGFLDLDELILEGRRLKVDPLHYSVRADGSAFSILAEISSPTEGDKELVAIYFTKNFPGFSRPSEVDVEFNYLTGPGRPLTWDEDVQVEVCKVESEEDEASIHRAVRSWAGDDSRIGDRSIRVSRRNTYPPFSDLNTSCVSFVDNYLFEDSVFAFVLGVTFPIIDMSRHLIVGGSIFISLDGVRKASPQKNPERVLDRTLVHELGHLWGLGHEFDRTEDGTLKYESVMGYGGVSVVTPHDRAALAAAYREPKSPFSQVLQSWCRADLSASALQTRRAVWLAEGERDRDAMDQSSKDCGRRTLASYRRLEERAELDLRDQGISDVSLLAPLRWLERLDLAQNQIEEVSALAELPRLQKLDLSENPLLDLRSIAEFPVLDDLTIEPLTLQEDPDCPADDHLRPPIRASLSRVCGANWPGP